MNTHEFLFAQNWVEQFRAEVYKMQSEGCALLHSSYPFVLHEDSLFCLIDAHYVDVLPWSRGIFDRGLWGRRQRSCCDQKIREEWASVAHCAVLDYTPLTR